MHLGLKGLKPNIDGDSALGLNHSTRRRYKEHLLLGNDLLVQPPNERVIEVRIRERECSVLRNNCVRGEDDFPRKLDSVNGLHEKLGLASLALDFLDEERVLFFSVNEKGDVEKVLRICNRCEDHLDSVSLLCLESKEVILLGESGFVVVHLGVRFRVDVPNFLEKVALLRDEGLELYAVELLLQRGVRGREVEEDFCIDLGLVDDGEGETAFGSKDHFLEVEEREVDLYVWKDGLGGKKHLQFFASSYQNVELLATDVPSLRTVILKVELLKSIGNYFACKGLDFESFGKGGLVYLENCIVLVVFVFNREGGLLGLANTNRA